MLMVLQVHRRTTLVVPFEKVVLHKIQMEVFSPRLKLNREIPVYKEKGNLIHIYLTAIFNLGKISF